MIADRMIFVESKGYDQNLIARLKATGRTTGS